MGYNSQGLGKYRGYPSSKIPGRQKGKNHTRSLRLNYPLPLLAPADSSLIRVLHESRNPMQSRFPAMLSALVPFLWQDRTIIHAGFRAVAANTSRLGRLDRVTERISKFHGELFKVVGDAKLMHCNKCCDNHKQESFTTTTASGNNTFTLSTSFDGTDSTASNYITYGPYTASNSPIWISSSSDCPCECHDLCGACDCG